MPTVWIGEDVFGRHRDAFGITACDGCSFEFVNPRPSDALLGEFYGGMNYTCHDPHATDTVDSRALHALEFMGRQVAGRRLLDFGCGAGVFLRCAVAQGWDATGYDVGGAAIESCRRQGLTVVTELDDIPRGAFDAVLLSHVFEHVTDHRATLAAVARALAPGGRVFIEVPNVKSLRARLSHPLLSRHARFDERYRAFPIHLSYFAPRTLRDVLEQSGFEVVDRVTWGFGIEELVMPAASEAAERPKPAPAASKPAARKPRPVKKLAKAVLTRLILDTGLGENIMIVARAHAGS